MLPASLGRFHRLRDGMNFLHLDVLIRLFVCLLNNVTGNASVQQSPTRALTSK